MLQSLGRIGFTSRELLFTNQAIGQCLGSFPTPDNLSEYASTPSLIEALSLGEVDTAFVPLEHSLYGTIRESILCLQSSHVSIINECRVPTSIALMAPPGTEFQHIQVVYGSELSFRLCASVLETLPKAGRELAAVPLGGKMDSQPWALLAPESYAHENGLAVLASNVSDHNDSTLRFVLCARSERSLNTRVPAKTSLLITCSQESGSLAQILELFTEGNIILTKLESLGKDLHSASEWIFLECQGIHNMGSLGAVIERLKSQNALVKVCGSYPRVDTPPRPALTIREERLR
jgi:chorismate mutase/prephenate dehydratase